MFSLPFSKKSGILYIRRNKAQLYLLGSASSLEVDFDKAVFENLEIKDKDAFESSLKEIIQKVGNKNISILIVLSGDIVFQKNLPKAFGGEIDQEIKKFIDAIPIDNDRLDYRIMPIEQGVAVVAANSMIYNIARDAVESSGWEVEAIIPSAFFGVTSNDITINVFAQIAKSKVSFGESDFMRKGEHGKIVPNPVSIMNKNKPVTSIKGPSTSAASSQEVKPLVEKSITGNKKTIVMVVLIVVLFGTAGFLLKKYHFTDKTKDNNVVTENVPIETLNTSESPTDVKSNDVAPEVPTEKEPVAMDKVDLRFNILNSTKVSGLAGKTKETLISDGYSNIVVGNSTDVLDNTQVILYKQIPEEYLEEISSGLKTTLGVSIIDVKEDFKEVYDFDIQITIAGVK